MYWCGCYGVAVCGLRFRFAVAIALARAWEIFLLRNYEHTTAAGVWRFGAPSRPDLKSFTLFLPFWASKKVRKVH